MPSHRVTVSSWLHSNDFWSLLITNIPFADVIVMRKQPCIVTVPVTAEDNVGTSLSSVYLVTQKNYSLVLVTHLVIAGAWGIGFRDSLELIAVLTLTATRSLFCQTILSKLSHCN